ncbi:hypothetical protein [Cytobacillus gottheilii]|uniref:hypothetical protein n=1 Tax=Cytobacillus gottheilii TaxID=859144 RepID=UPI0009BAEC4F|nr:hypothetical protein [Cytobacillus gottheilii]
MKKLDRTGEKKVNKNGSPMEIVKYTNNKDILVKFTDSGNVVRCAYSSFSKGSLLDPSDKTVYGVGYYGVGQHISSENHKMSHKYKTWHGMMRRCYDKEFHKRSPIYADCAVAEVWHNYQNFGDWYDENYYSIDGHMMHLDKDILVKGNKIYSPDTCIFVPAAINSLFIKVHDEKRKLYTCVYYNPKRLEYKYTARTKDKFIGSFKTHEEAANAYVKYKNLLFRDKAYEYKDLIPNKLYEAMLNYKVEIV